MLPDLTGGWGGNDAQFMSFGEIFDWLFGWLW